jgi:nucleoside recognition membrane protein YjiH
VVIGQVNLDHLFAPFYLTVCVVGVVAALILPRLPPLRFKKDEYVDGTKRDLDLESLPQDKTLFKYSIEVALIKACRAPSVKGTLDEGLRNAVNMVFAVLSEIGSLLIGSKIPVNLLDLFAIFVLRTLVTLPVIAAMALWLL